MACTIATGAMLKGRIKRKQTNVFLLHKKAAIYFGTFVLGTLLYGLFLEIQHGEPVLTSTHGKLGILLLLIVIFQIIPSLVLRDRTMIRKLHMILGYSLAPLIILEASRGLYSSIFGGCWVVGSLEAIII